MHIRCLLRKLARTGCDLSLSQDDMSRIILTNQIAFFFVLPPLPYIAILVFLKAYFLAFFIVPLICFYLASALWLNHTHCHTLAKFSIICIPAGAALFYGLVFGPNTGMTSLFLSLSVLSAVLFRPQDLWKISAGLGICFLGFMGGQFGTLIVPPLVQLTQSSRIALMIISSVTSFLILFFCLRFYLNLSRRYTELINTAEFVKKNGTLFSGLKITPRELEIILMLVNGFSNDHISSTLVISASTTKRHVYNIFKKLRINSRFELMRWVGGQT